MHPLVAALDLEALMREALVEARAAGERGEYPIGAVAVIDGHVVSRGRSRQRELRSQLAHAELEALQLGGEPVWARHDEAVLFTTVEPCPLCVGAAVMADMPHIVFAHPDPAVQASEIIERVPYVGSHIDTYLGGVLRDESRALFERYEPKMVAYLDDEVVTPPSAQLEHHLNRTALRMVAPLGRAQHPPEGERRLRPPRGPVRFSPMRRRYPSVLELVGDTPIVRLDSIGRNVEPQLLAKLEYVNPGGSVKDRIGLAMIEKAEAEGKLKPGGTIVEPTSGNTGVGLAIAAAKKGYRCIFVMPDKMSQEKISMLRAYGAEVVICPTAVEPDSPESYYSVSDRLAEQIPGGFKPDQYSNMSNPEAHYRTTGPEIWEQTGGDIDAIVISVGTGGTISGVGRYFKERSPEVLIVGADPEGSVYTAKDDRDVHPYLVEGIGKDTWPKTMDPTVVDDWVRVSDRDSFLTARRLAREEGLLVGGSGGTTVWAALELAKRFDKDAAILTMIPDSGRSYMSKFYDDNWMLEHGFAERRAPAPTISELLRSKRLEELEVPALITIAAHQKVGEAIDVMQRYSISQLPVVRDGEVQSLADVIGSLQDRDLLDRVFKNADALHEDVASAMQPPLAAIEADQTLDEVFATLTGRTNAVVVANQGKPVGVLTRSDLLEYLAHQRET
jgi:cystathionine beta-synthase